MGLGVADWFSLENQGAGVAVVDLDGNGKPDLVVMMVDNPPGQNRGVYRHGPLFRAEKNGRGGPIS